MKKEELAQYWDLLREIQDLRKRIHTLEQERVYTKDQVQASNQDFPYQPVTLKIEGYALRKPKSVKRLKKSLHKRYEKAMGLKLEIEEFIASIDDSRVRQVFEMRYIHGWTWTKISMELGSCHESYARKLHDRYLESIL